MRKVVFSDLVWRAKERDNSWVEWTWNWGLYVPELMIQLPSSLTRTQLLASSNSNSWSSSKLLRFSASYLDDLFLRRASQSGNGLAVEGPATVYLCA
jgi:hypothetical protein